MTTASKRNACLSIGAYVGAVAMLMACGGGGGGGGGSSVENDVLSAYVSGFSYNASTTIYKPWDSLELEPKVNYIKPNANLQFSTSFPSGVSLDAKSGKVIFAPSFYGGCVPVELIWTKTGERLVAQACMDKEYLEFVSGGLGLSVNGIWKHTISKTAPTDIELDVSLAYHDSAKNQGSSSGGVFPNGSTTICSVIDHNLPVLVGFTRTSESPTRLAHDLSIDWTRVPVGEYQYLAKCTLMLGQKSTSLSRQFMLKVIE